MFSGRMTRPTALEVSKWVRAIPGTNADRTVFSAGTSGPPPRPFTSVPAQNHLPVAVEEGIKTKGGEGRGLGSPCQMVTVTAGFSSMFLKAFANAL